MPPTDNFFMLLAHFSVCNSEKLDSPEDKAMKLLNIIVATVHVHVSGTIAFRGGIVITVSNINITLARISSH